MRAHSTEDGVGKGNDFGQTALRPDREAFFQPGSGIPDLVKSAAVRRGTVRLLPRYFFFQHGIAFKVVISAGHSLHKHHPFFNPGGGCLVAERGVV